MPTFDRATGAEKDDQMCFSPAIGSHPAGLETPLWPVFGSHVLWSVGVPYIRSGDFLAKEQIWAKRLCGGGGCSGSWGDIPEVYPH